MRHGENYPIIQLCRLLKVSHSGYYEWLTREESARGRQSRMLGVEIRAIHQQSRQAYGAIRVHRELKKQGKRCSKNRVARLMQEQGIRSTHKRKYRVCTTNSKHEHPIAENVIAQDFTATRPNQKWGCDITYIETREGWLYLAVVLDFYSRKVVGWAVSESMHATLCSDALRMALLRRNPPAELVHHSDRGAQYASFEYRSLLKSCNFTQSMSRKGNCYDNAMVESFMHSLKVECVHQTRYVSRESAAKDVAGYIECFYNTTRLHSALDYLSPVEYEQKFRLAA